MAMAVGVSVPNLQVTEVVRKKLQIEVEPFEQSLSSAFLFLNPCPVGGHDAENSMWEPALLNRSSGRDRFFHHNNNNQELYKKYGMVKILTTVLTLTSNFGDDSALLPFAVYCDANSIDSTCMG
nr:hypothetical protein Iba_chr15aCG6400 [Ipomoea batatas]